MATSISQEVMSPFCPGLTLHDCPSQAAIDLRARIEGWAEQGWSRDRIMQTLEAEYGPEIRAVPSGSNGLVAWLVPALAVIAGAVLLTLLLRRWTGRAEEPMAAPVTDASDRARLESELAALREATWGER